MQLKSKAAGLIAAVDPCDVSKVVSEYPEPEDIRVRERWREVNPHLGKRLPKDAAKRAEYLAEKIQDWKETLGRDVEAYKRYRVEGLRALCAYDVCIASGNNPLAALGMALRLKHAHISYALSALMKLQLELKDAQKQLSDAQTQQLALF